ncbi:MAG TPA: hypothetical protein VMZ53_16775 [Kofleriaceae bacterium]|nr:hypothetical protein [Kofleriaceae bacterium]
MTRVTSSLLATVLALAACGDDPAVAYFKVPSAAANEDFYDLPWPNNYWRKADGTLDLSQFPTNAVIANTVREIAQRDLDGFGKNAVMFVRFSGALDDTSLPSPEASVTDAASVYVVDVDAMSPDKGKKTPVVVTFHEEGTQTMGGNRLAIRPFPGFPLRDGTTYALVVTKRVHDSNGNTIQRDGDFSSLITSTGGSEAISVIRTTYEPLLSWLDEAGGDERGDVIAASVFTTQHATKFGPALRKGVYGAPAPVATDLMKGPAGTAFTLFSGKYEQPNFQAGLPAYISSGGEITIGSDGAAVVTRMEPMRFALSVPTGAVPTNGFPICIYQHGTGGDWVSFLGDGTAERLAAQGIAVISTDQVLHGPRGAGTDPSIAFFNFNNPVAGRDNPLQGAADAWAMQRLVAGLTIPASLDGARDITFNMDKLFFFGHSQGGLTGPAYIAFEPTLKGAVLSGTGGTFYLSTLTKTEPVNFPDLIATLIRDEPVNEDNPTLGLAQMAVERSDGVNYAPLMVREPPLGDNGMPLAPKNIFQTEGFTDHYSPNAVIEAFAVALGGDIVELPDQKELEGVTLRERGIMKPPFKNNVAGVTVALGQYKQAGTSDGHFVVFDVGSARKQSSQFLGTLAATGQATVVSP